MFHDDKGPLEPEYTPFPQTQEERFSGFYETGNIRPPKNHGGWVAAVLLTCIFLGGLAGGAIEPGAPADLAVLDLNRPHTIDAAAFRSLGHATPFDGWGVGAAVALTLCGGQIVHHDLGNEEEL